MTQKDAVKLYGKLQSSYNGRDCFQVQFLCQPEEVHIESELASIEQVFKSFGPNCTKINGLEVNSVTMLISNQLIKEFLNNVVENFTI